MWLPTRFGKSLYQFQPKLVYSASVVLVVSLLVALIFCQECDPELALVANMVCMKGKAIIPAKRNLKQWSYSPNFAELQAFQKDAKFYFPQKIIGISHPNEYIFCCCSVVMSIKCIVYI